MNEIVEAKTKAERVHINRPLALWAAASGMMVGVGVEYSSSLAIIGLMAGGVGLGLADLYEKGKKTVQATEESE